MHTYSLTHSLTHSLLLLLAFRQGLQSALSEFYGQFYGAVDTMTKLTPPDYTFYDGMYSFYSTGAVGADRAEVCVMAMKPSTGPADGGTTVYVKAQGSVPFGHADFYCVFQVAGEIQRAASVTYDSSDDSIILQCTVPSGSARTIEYVGISLDGSQVSPLGAPFYYHSSLDLSSISPTTGDSHGGTDVTLTFSELNPLPSGADPEVVYATCRFSHTNSAGTTTVKETEGTYTATSGSTHASVECTTPGFSVDIPQGDIVATVSLNGIDYSSTSLTHAGVRLAVTTETILSTSNQLPLLNIYGLQLPLSSSIVSEDMALPGSTDYPEQTLYEATAVAGAPYMTFTYSTSMCLTYPQTSLATLSNLMVEGDFWLPDYSTTSYSTSVLPTFKPGILEYTATVPYQLYSGFSLSGTTSDSFANMFVRGQAVPRDGVSVVTAHNEEGETEVEMTVLSSDSSTSLTYAVSVIRDAPGTVTEVEDVVITGATDGTTTISPSWNSSSLTGYTARVRFLYSAYLLINPTMVDPYAKAVITANSTSDSITVGYLEDTPSANISLPVGFSIITITGVSEGGVISSSSVYEIEVERVAAQTVSSIIAMTTTTTYPDAAGGNVLSPTVWDAATTSYTLTLLFEQDSVIFQPLTEDDAQATTASLNGAAGVAVEYNQTFTASGLAVGSSTVNFTTVAEDGTNTTIYIVTIVRQAKSTDATLSLLDSQSCSDTTQGVLEPNFTSSTYSYDATISHQCALDDFYFRVLGTLSNDQWITLTPVCNDYFCSSISVTYPNGTTVVGTNGTAFEVPVPTSSTLGQTVDAASNIPVTVTAEDGTTTAVYYVNTTRLARSTIAGLLNLTVDGSYTATYPTSGVLYQVHSLPPPAPPPRSLPPLLSVRHTFPS